MFANSQSFRAGAKFLLTCVGPINYKSSHWWTVGVNANGFPPPKTLWLRRGNQVEINAAINGSFTNPNKNIVSITSQTDACPTVVDSVLYIEKADLTDAGAYSCLATNNLAETLDSSFGTLLTVLNNKY